MRIGGLNRLQYPEQRSGPIPMRNDRLVDQQPLLNIQDLIGCALHDSSQIMPERNFYAAEASLDVPQITAVYTN
jgi:hypothetical protein